MAVLAVAWAGLVGLLIAVGEAVTHSGAATSFDRQVTREAVSSRTAALNSAMKVVTWLGSWVALLVAARVTALLVLTRRLPLLAAIVAVAAWAGEALGVRVTTEVVDRNRPPRAIWMVQAHGWSFPSGHTATAALAFSVLALCVAATAFSWVELGVHWTTDVMASVVFVAGWLAAIAVLIRGLATGRGP
jgi:membrane-associated phospholipid phosphatase